MTEAVGQGPVLARTEGTTRVLTLNRPEARNAINFDMRRVLGDLLREADAHDDIAAIVITGADPAFCAGVDVKDLARTRASGPPPGPNPAAAVRAVATPVIAAVNGACVTGGLEVALSCDIVVASDRARFADTHTRNGLVPGRGMWGMSALLPDAVGIHLAKELSLTGRFVEADEALCIGLVGGVVDHDQLVAHALELAAAISQAPPGAAAAWLEIYDRGAGLGFEERLALIDALPGAAGSATEPTAGEPPRRSVRLSRDEAWKVLEEAHTVIFATLRRDGSPISLPVWFVVHEGEVFISTPAGAKKAARVRHDPRAALLVESGKRWAELRGVHLTGRAEVLADDDVRVTPVRRAIEAKYAAFRTQRADMPAATRSSYERSGEHLLIRFVPDDKILTWDNARLGLG